MKRAARGLILMLVSLALAGCWDRREIEERSTILIVTLDRSTPQERLSLGALVAVPGGIPLGGAAQGGGSPGPAVTPVVTTGRTTLEALSNLHARLNQIPFFGHTRIIAVSENTARQGIEDMLDAFRRHNQIRRLLWLIVVRGEANQLLQFRPPVERVPPLFLVDMLDDLRRRGQIPNTFFGRFITQAINPGEDPAIPLLEVKGNDVRFLGLAVFNEEKMVGSIDRSETWALLQILGVSKASEELAIPADNGEVGLQLSGRRSSIQPQGDGDDLRMRIRIELEGNLREVIGGPDASKPENLRRAERLLETRVKRNAEALIQKMQGLGVDIFGFGEIVRAQKPKEWEAKSWRERFRTLQVQVEVKAFVRRTGMTED